MQAVMVKLVKYSNGQVSTGEQAGIYVAAKLVLMHV